MTSEYEKLAVGLAASCFWHGKRTESLYRIQPPVTVEGVGLTLARRSERRVNITATLPLEFLERIDELIDDDTAPSRSFVIREAVKKYVEAF